MAKQNYWIADPNTGAKALVEGAEERNLWTLQHGWSESDEPAAEDQVWVHNSETDGRSTLPFGAVGEGSYWRGVGFSPSAPPEPVDLTKDPARRDQPKSATKATSAAKTDESTTTKVAAGADKNKEQ